MLLTICLGEVLTMLRQQQFVANSVFLKYQPSTANALLDTVKSIARLCKPGTNFQTTSSDMRLQAGLRQCGFITAGPDGLQATYNPAWLSKKPLAIVPRPGTCVVIGAGLAGAAVASSLARRGWAVTILDAAPQPASGASSLPAGLLVPHTSPNDSPLSRLSRSGVRTTLQQAHAFLRHGIDWGHTGVLQRSFKEISRDLPPAWAREQIDAASDWCYPASAKTLAAARLPPGSTALWHVQAGWLKPCALVSAWLASPGVTWLGGAPVAKVEKSGNTWCLRDAAGIVLAEADLIVLCAGQASRLLAETAGAVPPELQPVRGQITHGLQLDSQRLPPFPINGHGGLIPGITTPNGAMWLMGASYERDISQPTLKPHDHVDNLARLQTLLPSAVASLEEQFHPNQAQGWAGIRCTTPNRLPVVSPLAGISNAWLCTGMGSRGLSFAALCGELLAARLHAEPLPIEKKLAEALSYSKLRTL